MFFSFSFHRYDVCVCVLQLVCLFVCLSILWISLKFSCLLCNYTSTMKNYYDYSNEKQTILVVFCFVLVCVTWLYSKSSAKLWDDYVWGHLLLKIINITKMNVYVCRYSNERPRLLALKNVLNANTTVERLLSTVKSKHTIQIEYRFKTLWKKIGCSRRSHNHFSNKYKKKMFEKNIESLKTPKLLRNSSCNSHV